MKLFGMIEKCQACYQSKTHEDLLMKRRSLVLNKELCAKGASFLLAMSSIINVQSTIILGTDFIFFRILTVTM